MIIGKHRNIRIDSGLIKLHKLLLNISNQQKVIMPVIGWDMVILEENCVYEMIHNRRITLIHDIVVIKPEHI